MMVIGLRVDHRVRDVHRYDVGGGRGAARRRPLAAAAPTLARSLGAASVVGKAGRPRRTVAAGGPGLRKGPPAWPPPLPAWYAERPKRQTLAATAAHKAASRSAADVECGRACPKGAYGGGARKLGACTQRRHVRMPCTNRLTRMHSCKHACMSPSAQCT